MLSVFQIGVGVQFDRFNQPIDAEDLHDNLLPSIRRMLASEFGGYTEKQTSGGWINPDGHLVEEEGRTFSVLYDPTKVSRNLLAFRADCVGQILNQHSVVRIWADNDASIKKVAYPLSAPGWDKV